MINREKWQKIRARMTALNIHETDLIEKFILGSGRGGQKIQKTLSCVYLKHRETGIEIKCQKTRSRDDNRYFARKRLCDKLDERVNQEKSEYQQAKEKIRRQKKRRRKRTKDKLSQTIHSEKKARRGPIATKEME